MERCLPRRRVSYKFQPPMDQHPQEYDGMIMNNAYAASPKCGTSRYSTVTGRYASRSSSARRSSWRNAVHPVMATIPNTKLEDQSRVVDGNDCSHSNVAQVFSKNGYVTGMVGKWHLSNTG